jgi:hypothetical protein
VSDLLFCLFRFLKCASLKTSSRGWISARGALIVAGLLPVLSPNPVFGGGGGSEETSRPFLRQLTPFKSVQEALPFIQATFGNQKVWNYATENLKQPASFQAPRVISFKKYENGDVLFASLNGECNPEKQSLEIIRWDPMLRSYVFYEAAFTPSGTEITENPAGCFQCHGKLRPHLNWRDWTRWEGSYGNVFFADHADQAHVLREKNEWSQFLQGAAAHEIYSKLSPGPSKLVQMNELAFETDAQSLKDFLFYGPHIEGSADQNVILAILMNVEDFVFLPLLKKAFPSFRPSPSGEVNLQTAQKTLSNRVQRTEKAIRLMREKAISGERINVKVPFDPVIRDPVANRVMARLIFFIEELKKGSLRDLSMSAHAGAIQLRRIDGNPTVGHLQVVLGVMLEDIHRELSRVGAPFTKKFSSLSMSKLHRQDNPSLITLELVSQLEGSSHWSRMNPKKKLCAQGMKEEIDLPD